MKTSKIIFIALLGSIAVLILAALVNIRLNGRKNNNFQYEFSVIKRRIPTYKVLCVNNSMNITLVHNDSSFIEVTYLKDSIVPDKNVVIREDTLFITDFEKLIHRNVSVRIFATDSLKKIELQHSQISLGKSALKSDQSSTWFSRDTTLSSFKALDIVAKNHSNVNSGIFRIDSLGIVLQHSVANLTAKVRRINGTLSDSSKIYVRQPLEISLKRDSTSKINVNYY